MDLQSVFTEAVQLHQVGKYQEALNRYLLILDVLPDNVSLLSNVGLAYRDLGRADDALGFCLKAVRQAPNDPNQLVNLGAVYESLSRIDEAAATYEQALALAPHHAKALNNLGKLYHLLGQSERGLTLIRHALAVEPDNPLALNNLGVILSDSGDFQGAAAAFEKSLHKDPTNSDLLFNLSGLYNCRGDLEKARQVLERLLALQPDHESAQYMLAALDGSVRESAPPGYVTETFDKYAYRFERHIGSCLGYTVPQRLAEMLQAHYPDRQFASAIDLGCGTGLVGAALRNEVHQLTGIDLSPRMLEVAARKGHYHHLVQDELGAFLDQTEARYDLFIAADVFIYLGKLERICAGLSRTACRHAVLACSIERLSDEPSLSYRLRPSGRFAHAPAYLVGCAARYGFRHVGHQSLDIRKENGSWIPGDLFIFERDAGKDGDRA